MRGHELLDKMERIAPHYIEEAEHKPQNQMKAVVKWGTLAACFALMIFVGARLLSGDTPGTYQGLPVLTISQEQESMGMEIHHAYDISEMVSANPWHEDMDLKTLPVFKNKDAPQQEVRFDEMRKCLMDLADRIGMDTDTPAFTEKEASILMFEANGMRVEIDTLMQIKIWFEPEVSLPEEYDFSDQASYEELCAVAEYLKSEYRDLIGFDDPQTDVYGGGYSIHEDQLYSVEFFDSGDTDSERIVNYNFNRVVFCSHGEGNLYLVKIERRDLSEKVGDYPIITADEALELLGKGVYRSSCRNFPGLEYVRKVDLVYRTQTFEEYYMPYYRFYVELPEEAWNSYKGYGVYYVPAIRSEYISNMPTWGVALY